MLEHGPAAGAFVKFGNGFLAPFGEAEEAGEHAGAEDQPFRGVGVDGLGTGHDPEDEQRRQGHDVDDHDLFEAEAVGDLDDAVADDEKADLPVDQGEGGGDRAEGVPASFETQLRSQAQPLMQAGRLAILGWVESLSEVYAAMDVFCFPSDNEGFGLVAVEAMFMGLPVVRTDIAGGEDMIVEGENGFLVPAGDLDALTDRVARLLSDPALAARMGAAGQRIAHERFTAGRMAAEVETLMLARVAQFTHGA